jgi:hypothetical protein
MGHKQKSSLYEAAGWERIKLELEVGDFQFVPVDTCARQEAREWAEAKEQEERAALGPKLQPEQSRFDEIRRWTIIASVAAVVAAITGLIAVFQAAHGAVPRVIAGPAGCFHGCRLQERPVAGKLWLASCQCAS